MDEKKFNRIVRNPRHIAGVFNYCDRWCERCPLTLRCSVYAMGQVLDKERHPEGHDRAGEGLWPRLEGVKGLAEELLVKHGDHRGVMPVAEPVFSEVARPMNADRLGAAAKRYMEFASGFLKAHEKGVAEAAGAGELGVTVGEALEVVGFYHLFITVKMARVLLREEGDEEMEAEGMPSDRDGSAKIALIAIDRSILAWAALTKLGAGMEEVGLSAMVSLARLRAGIEKRFVKARLFVRPGFDTLRFK